MDLDAIAARLAALRLGVRFDLRDRRQLGQLRDAHLLQALDDGDALVAEVRRLQAIEAAAREVAAVDGHWGQTDTQIAEDMDWQGSEAHIPVEVSRAAFVTLLRALLGSGAEVDDAGH